MEAIWEDPAPNDKQAESPEWHREALAETDRRHQSGQEGVVDWQEAKKELRRRFETSCSSDKKDRKKTEEQGCKERKRTQEDKDVL
jgi:hypothetical protein